MVYVNEERIRKLFFLAFKSLDCSSKNLKALAIENLQLHSPMFDFSHFFFYFLFFVFVFLGKRGGVGFRHMLPCTFCIGLCS
jgi:hypothetical protein